MGTAFINLLSEYGIDMTDTKRVIESGNSNGKKLDLLIERIRTTDPKLANLFKSFCRMLDEMCWKKSDVRPDGKRKFMAVDNSGSVYICMYDKMYDRLVYDDDPTAHRTWETCAFEKWAYLEDIV